VEVGVAGAAHAVLEGHRHQPPDHLVAVDPVVLSTDPDAVVLQVADRDLEGLGPSLGQQPPGLGAAAGGQQRHALGRAEAVVEGLHPLVDPLAPMLPRLVEPVPVQLAWIGAQDLAAEPLDRLDLDPLGGVESAGRLHGAHVRLQRLGSRQRLQVVGALLGGSGLEGRQQRPGGQLGAWVSPPQRRAALSSGGRVEALEHGPHLLGAGGPLQAGRGGRAADEPAR
jgi:hypothetical protein